MQVSYCLQMQKGYMLHIVKLLHSLEPFTPAEHVKP